MKKGKETYQRLNKIINKDKGELPSEYIGVLRSEITEILAQYADFEENGVMVGVSVDEGGYYVIEVRAKTERLKNLPIVF